MGWERFMTEADKREINKNHVAAFLCLIPSSEILQELRAKHDASSLCQFWKQLRTGMYLVQASCVPHLSVCLGEKYHKCLWASLRSSSKLVLQEIAPQMQSIERERVEGRHLYWFHFQSGNQLLEIPSQTQLLREEEVGCSSISHHSGGITGPGA